MIPRHFAAQKTKVTGDRPVGYMGETPFYKGVMGLNRPIIVVAMEIGADENADSYFSDGESKNRVEIIDGKKMLLRAYEPSGAQQSTSVIALFQKKSDTDYRKVDKSYPRLPRFEGFNEGKMKERLIQLGAKEDDLDRLIALLHRGGKVLFNLKDSPQYLEITGKGEDKLRSSAVR